MTTQSTNLTAVEQRYWDDVRVGDKLDGFDLELGWTKMAEQVSGSQDFYAVHHDPGFAAEAGHETIFYNTGFTPGSALPRGHRLGRARGLAAEVPLRDAADADSRGCRARPRQGDRKAWTATTNRACWNLRSGWRTNESASRTPGWATVRLPRRS